MNEKLYELIEDYNLGRLKPPQLEQFEAALANDPALANAVATQRAEWEMRELLAENALRAQIRQGFAERPPSLWITRNWKWLLPVLLCLGAAGYLFYRNTPAPAEALPPAVPPSAVPADTVSTPQVPPSAPPPQQPNDRDKNMPDPRIYAMAAYEMPESLSGMRGANTEDTLGLAQNAFAEKNYRKVVSLLTVLPPDERQEALHLRAHARFGLQRFAEAARDFSELEKGGIYRREAQWYGLLARAATPSAKRNEWTKDLDAIRNDGTHPYRKQANDLWQRLNK
jgi:hypothetical protein